MHASAKMNNFFEGVGIGLTPTKQSWKRRRMVAGPETGDSLNC